MNAEPCTLVREETSLDSDLVPDPVPIVHIGPTGGGHVDLPVIIALHGGLHPRGAVALAAAAVGECVEKGTLPPCRLVAPISDRSFWADFSDGSALWERFLAGPLIEHAVGLPGVSPASQVCVCGVSMGGLGALRLAFRHPERFAAVAALEPGIEPAIEWSEVDARHLAYRAPEVMERIFGSPIDPVYWRAQNPAAILLDNKDRTRASGLAIYLEVGDEDVLHLDDGAEFLHRLMADNGVRHEYHLVHGANHVGVDLVRRMTEAVEFMGRALVPAEPDLLLAAFLPIAE